MSDPRLGFFDDFLHLFGWDDVVIGPEAKRVVKSIRDVSPHVVRQVSLSQNLPDRHVPERRDDLIAGIAGAEFFLHVPIDDQRQIAGEEMSFDVVFQTDISRPCFEF